MERQDASVRLTDLLRAVVDTVPVYSKLPSTTTREIADDSSLLHSICSFEFFMPDYSKRMSIINAKPKRGKCRMCSSKCFCCKKFNSKFNSSSRNELENVVYGFRKPHVFLRSWLWQEKGWVMLKTDKSSWHTNRYHWRTLLKGH